MTPATAQRAPLEKKGSAYTGAIVDSVPLDIENDSLHGQMIGGKREIR
jgi:hypothetical protein